MNLIRRLLPANVRVRLRTYRVDVDRHQIVVHLTSTQRGVRCPMCNSAAKRVHSRYERTVADQPWADWAVRLKLLVRKFYCINPACERIIFCERIPTIAQHRARSTHRLREQLRHIALCAGASPGARLARKLDREVSCNTLLRLVRTAPRMAFPVPRVVGVDDWAKRKGQAYGSIIVDLERRQILELLPDREANTLSQWLQAHPGTEIICRDRASAYADGASRGEPSAIQVVDRFHLIRNLGEMLQRVFEEHRRDLNSSSVADESPALIVDPSIQVVIQKAQGTSTPVVELPADDRPPREHTRQRQLHYEQVRALRAEGWTLSAIARHLGIRRQTVSTYCHSTTFPDRSRTTKLDPFKAYILQRWNSGFRTGTVLFAEIVQLGYRGQRSVALAYITRLREASGLPARSRMLTPKVAVNDQRANKVTCRQAAFLVLRREPKEDEKLKITAWRAAHPALDEAIGRTLDFADIMRIRGFARSLRRDEHAVRAAVELPWSTGPVEGHINRLKTLKRQMYGRAMLDLLEKRLLHSSA